jgi:hypothetical protein
LFRSGLIRSSRPFFNEANIHADNEACYEVLQNCDFGFVHQVLIYNRVHDESVSSLFSQKVQSHLAADLLFVKKYGPIYLTSQEFQLRLEARSNEYYGFLAKSFFLFRDRDFWKYHKDALTAAGCPLRTRRLLEAVLREAMDILLHPGGTLRKMIRVLWRGRILETRRFQSQSLFKKIAVGK